jgi:hypothetical protein
MVGASAVPMNLLIPLVIGCADPSGSPGHPADSDTVPVTHDSADPPDPIVPERMCAVDVRCSGNILDEPKAPCDVAMRDADGTVIYDGRAGIELRGRSSLTFPKPQYSVELRASTELPIWPGSRWKYLDDGSNQGSAWRAVSFDDSAWASGSAPLGYGEDYLNTTLRSASDDGQPFTTTYLRYAFTPADRAAVTHLEVGLMYQHGAVVYLNGHEVAREDLPDDATYLTPADGVRDWVDAIRWDPEVVDPSLLVDGENVLAIELHRGPDTSDLRFDLYLEGAGDDADTDVLAMGDDADWVFNGMYADRVLFRNRLAFDLFQSFGGKQRFAPESRFCELDLNGEYEGIYSVGEKIEPGDGRVRLEAGDEPGDSFVIKLDDAYGFHPNEVGYGTWQVVYPENVGAEPAIDDVLDRWEAAVHGPPAADADSGMFAELDMDSAVDWVILEELFKNMDAYQLSVHLWKDVDGKMHFAPWDLDLSLGYPYTDCGATGWLHRYEYVDAMAASPAFHAALVARWAELRQDQLSDEAIRARIAAYDATLAPGLARELQRWPIDDIAFQTDDVTVDDWLCPVSSYDDEHTRVLDFLSARLAWMDDNIDSF